MKRPPCPGSGLPLLEREYIVRQIEPKDREKCQRDVERALERGDQDEAEIIREVFAEWERDQGTHKTFLVCSVCQERILSPTRDGRARRHARRANEQPSWDRVWILTKQIQALQAELDQLLHALEPD